MADKLSPEAREVLAALVCGLELLGDGESWHFDGPIQRPEASGVSSEIVSALLRDGFVRLSAGITPKGRHAYQTAETVLAQDALTWLRSQDSRKQC